jgi:hypothetical protein
MYNSLKLDKGWMAKRSISAACLPVCKSTRLFMNNEEDLDLGSESETTDEFNDRRSKDENRDRSSFSEKTFRRKAIKFSTSPVFKNSVAWSTSSYLFYTSNVDQIHTTQRALDFGVGIDFVRLDYQAECFANEMCSLNLDFKRAFGLDGNAEKSWNYKFRQLYVYSYVKSLLCGLNSAYFSSFPEQSYVFLGHAVLLEILRLPYCIVSADFNVQIYLSLSVTPDEKKSITEAIFKQYDWVEECIFFDNSGQNYRIFSPEIERRFSNLERQCVRSDDDRLLNIVNLANRAEYSSFASETNIPLGNSCFSQDFDKFLFINCPKHDIRSVNFFWSRANFIYNKTDNTELQTGNKIWYEIPSNRLNDFHVVSDVQAITGMKPSTSPKYLSSKSKNIPPLISFPSASGGVEDSP